MNSPSDAATSSPLTPFDFNSANPGQVAGPATREIKIGKRPAFVSGKEVEVFTMTMGVETVELLPLRRWGQIDIYKWRVRGKLPGTPAGLEITFDHLKLLGETVSYKDPEGCAKVEKLFAEWLALERENLELARKKAQAKPAQGPQGEAPMTEAQPLRFQVEVDKKGMVHVHCLQGKETLASIGLNTAGFQSLVSQGFMRKPHSLKTGALHDWVEIDEVLFSFEKGNDDSAKLAQALNASYLPPAGFGQGKEVVIFSNAASSTGFDIQFPAKVGGLTENRRRPLTEEALDLMQDYDHCELLQKGLVIKLTRPTLIFKQKTADGGEQYLRKCEANLVRVVDDEGVEKLIDLSQPVNYLHLTAVELTAVFNHPSINRHVQAAPPGSAPAPAAKLQGTPASTGSAGPVPAKGSSIPQPPGAKPETPASGRPSMAGAPPMPGGGSGSVQARTAQAVSAGPSIEAKSSPALPPKAGVPEASARPSLPPKSGVSLPNAWVKPVLLKQPIRHDWLTCLLYDQLAARFGNSEEGTLPDGKCWVVTLEEGPPGEPEDTPAKAVFLTESGVLGFASGPYVIRFENGFTSIGKHPTGEEPVAPTLMTGNEVHLLAVGMDAADRFVFLVSESYQTRFGVPEATLAAELASLKAHGGLLMSIPEVLASAESVKVVWTVPAEQPDAANPQVVENTPAGSGGA